MGILTENAAWEAVYIIFFMFWLLFVYFVRYFDYWQKRGVPYKPATFPFGSLPGLVFFFTPQATVLDKLYRQFSHERFFGIISVRRPTIVIIDPNLIKDILCKNFSHFTDRYIVEMSTNEYLNHNLVTMKGNEWKETRMNLTPAYTACKMKMMYFFVRECCENLSKAIDQRVEMCNVIDVGGIVSRFTLDSIGSCAFGFEANTLFGQNSEFFKMASTVLSYDFHSILKLYFIKAFPFLKKFSRFKMIPDDKKKYFTSLTRETVDYRETNNVRRLDFLDLLIRLKKNESILDDEVSVSKRDDNVSYKNDHCNKDTMIEQIAAETYIFLVAGFETSASVITFCLYELAFNHKIQDNVFFEIEEVLNRFQGLKSYQSLQEMTYVDLVIKETMRLYPPFSFINRVCTKNYKIPNSDVTIEEGVPVLIPTFSLHRDPKYFPDPETFCPERFSAEVFNKKNLQYVYMPFGEGPRTCIGYNYGLMLAKAAVVTILHDYSLSLSPDSDIPLSLDSKKVILQPARPLQLIFTRRSYNTS